MGPILDRTIHARSKGIDLDLRLAAPLPAETWRQLQTEVQTHRHHPIPGTLGPIELDAHGPALRLGFPCFDPRTTRLDSVLDQVRAHPVLRLGLLARSQALGRRLQKAGRHPEIGDPAAILVHPEGRVALLGTGTPILRRLLLGPAAEPADLEAELLRLAGSLGHRGPLENLPDGATFAQAWRTVVGGAGLKGTEVLSGPMAKSNPPAPAEAPPLRLALPDAPGPEPSPKPASPPPKPDPSPTARPSRAGPQAKRPSTPPMKQPTGRRGLENPALAALAAASPEAQMAALRASERPLRTPPQSLWIGLALLLIAVAFVILFRTHQGVAPEASDLAPPVPRPLKGSGYQPPPPSAIGRPPGTVPRRAGAPSRRQAPSPSASENRPELSGLLSVVSKPSGATVRLDGEVLGKTPVVIRRGLVDRSYELSIQMAGYETWSRKLRPDPQTGALSAIVELRAR